MYPASYFRNENINITSLGWYATLDSYASLPVRIFLKTQAENTLSTSIWSDFLEGATLVYDAPVNSIAANVWNIINLESSYHLDAGNNLLVLVETNYGAAGAGTSTMGSRILATRISGVHLRWGTDGFESGSVGTMDLYRPNLLIGYTGYDIDSAPNPVTPIYPQNNAILVENNKSLKWITGGGGAAGFKLNLGTDNPPTNIVQNLDLGTGNSYPLSNMQNGQVYYWQVVPYNSFGDAQNAPVWSFRMITDWTIGIGNGNEVSVFPFPGNYDDARTQMLFTASELLEAGMSPNLPIDALGLDFSTLTGIPINDLLIRITHSDLININAFVNAADFQTCYQASHPIAKMGWNYFTFSNPFMWDGVSSLLVDLSYNNSAWTMEMNQTRGSVAPGKTVARFANGANGATMGGGIGQNIRPNTRFVLADPPTGTLAAPLLMHPETASINMPIEGFNLVWMPDLANGSVPDYYIVYMSHDDDPVANAELVEEIHIGRRWNPVLDGGIVFNHSERWFWTVSAAATIDGIFHEEVAEIRWFEVIPTPPAISVSASSIVQNLQANETATQSLTIQNTGGRPLSYSIGFSEDQRAAAILSYDPANPVLPSQYPNIESQPAFGLEQEMAERATFDLQFNYGLSAAEYGVATDGAYLYTSHWETPGMIGRYLLNGTAVDTFIIPNAGQIRDLTYDGRFFYGAANSNIIYIMDFNTGTLEGTIPSPFNNTRGIAYDPDNDGFWISNAWSANCALISRSGNTIRTLTLGGASNGGLAYDNVSGTEPTLWGNAETQPNFNNITQYNLTNGAIIRTFNAADVIPEIILDSDIAGGGMDIAVGLVPGKASLLCVAQGLSFYGLELCDVDYWVSINPRAGVVMPGSSVVVEIAFDSENLDSGQYSGTMLINHNAEGEALSIPVTLNVLGGDFELSPVSDLSASLNADGSISLNWSAVAGAEWYIIYGAETPYGSYSPIGIVQQAGGLNIPASQLSGNKYFIRVTAGNGIPPQLRKM